MTQITTHVLDTSRGAPAAGVAIVLDDERTAVTDGDGRASLGTVAEGAHRLAFDVSDRSEFFPLVTIAFAVPAGEEHVHVPLLLSPFGYTTYRGS